MANILDVRIVIEEGGGWALYEPVAKVFIKTGLSESELIDQYVKMFEKAARASAIIAIKNAKSQIRVVGG